MEDSFAVQYEGGKARMPTVSEVMEECVQHWYRRIQKVLLRALSTPQKITCTRSSAKDRPNGRGWVLGTVADQLNELRSRLDDVDLPSGRSEDTLVCQCSFARDVSYFGQLKLARLAVVMSIVEKMDGLLSEILDADLNHDFYSSARGPISADVQIGGDEQKLLYECVLFRTPDKSDGQFRIVYMIFVQSDRAYGDSDSVQVFKREYRPGNDEMALYNKIVCTPINAINKPISMSNFDPNPIVIEDADLTSDMSKHNAEEVVTIDLSNLQFLRRNSLIIINEDGSDVVIDASTSPDDKVVIEIEDNTSDVIEIVDDSKAKRGTFEKSSYGPFKSGLTAVHPRRQGDSLCTGKRKKRSPLKGARKVFKSDVISVSDEDDDAGRKFSAKNNGYIVLQRRQKSDVDENNARDCCTNFGGRLKKLGRKNRAHRLDKAKTVRALWKRSRLRRAQQENVDPRLLKLRKGVRRFSRRARAKFGTLGVDFKDGDFKLKHREIGGTKTGSAKIFGRFFRVLSRFGRLRTQPPVEFDGGHGEVLWSETFHVDDRFTYVVVEDPDRGCFVGKEVDGDDRRKVQGTSGTDTTAVAGHSAKNEEDKSRDGKRSKNEESNRTDDSFYVAAHVNSSSKRDEESYQAVDESALAEIDENGNNLAREELVSFKEADERSKDCKKAINHSNDSPYRKQIRTGTTGRLNNAANEGTSFDWSVNAEKSDMELVPRKKHDLEDESSKIPSSKEHNKTPKAPGKPEAQAARNESTAGWRYNKDICQESDSNMEGNAVIQGYTKKRTRIKSTSTCCIGRGRDLDKEYLVEKKENVELNSTFFRAEEIKGIKSTTTQYFSGNVGQKNGSSRGVSTNIYAEDVDEKKKGIESTSTYYHSRNVEQSNTGELCSSAFVDKITKTSKGMECYYIKKLDVNREMYTRTCAENVAADKDGIESTYFRNIKNTTEIEEGTTNTLYDNNNFLRTGKRDLEEDKLLPAVFRNQSFVYDARNKQNVEFITVCDDNKNVTIYETDLSESATYFEKLSEQNLLEETERIKEEMHERFLECFTGKTDDVLDLFLEPSVLCCRSSLLGDSATSDRLSEDPNKLTAPVGECSVTSNDFDFSELSDRKGNFIENRGKESDCNEYVDDSMEASIFGDERECLANTDTEARVKCTLLAEIAEKYKQEIREGKKNRRSNSDLNEENVYQVKTKCSSEIELLEPLKGQVESLHLNSDEFSEPIVLSSADGSLLSEPDRGGEVVGCNPDNNELSKKDQESADEEDIIIIADSTCSSFTAEQKGMVADLANPFSKEMFHGSSESNSEQFSSDGVIPSPEMEDSTCSSFAAEQKDAVASESDLSNPSRRIIDEKMDEISSEQFSSNGVIPSPETEDSTCSSFAAEQRDVVSSESDRSNPSRRIIDEKMDEISFEQFSSDGTISLPEMEDGTCVSSTAERKDKADLENSLIDHGSKKIKFSSTISSPEIADIKYSSSGDGYANGFISETYDKINFGNKAQYSNELRNGEIEVATDADEETLFGSNLGQFAVTSATEDSVPKINESTCSSCTAELRDNEVEVNFVDLFSGNTYDEKIETDEHANHIDGSASDDGLSSLVVGDDTRSSPARIEVCADVTNACSSNDDTRSSLAQIEVCADVTNACNEATFQQGDDGESTSECINIPSPEIEDIVTNDCSKIGYSSHSFRQEVDEGGNESVNIPTQIYDDLDVSEISLEQFDDDVREGASQDGLMKIQSTDVEDSSSCAPEKEANLTVPLTKVETLKKDYGTRYGYQGQRGKTVLSSVDNNENLKHTGEIIESLKLLKVRKDSVRETRNSSKDGYWEIVKDVPSKNSLDVSPTRNLETTKVFQATASSKRSQAGNTSKKGQTTTAAVKDKEALEANNMTLSNRQKRGSASVSSENLSSLKVQTEIERHVAFIHDYTRRKRHNDSSGNNQVLGSNNTKSPRECLSPEAKIVHNKKEKVEASVPMTKSLMLRIPLDKVTLPEGEYYVESDVPNPLKLKINKRRPSDGRRASAETLEDGPYFDLLQKSWALEKGTDQEEGNAKWKKEETADCRAAPKIKILNTKNGFQTVLDDPLMDQGETKFVDPVGTTKLLVDEPKICVRISDRILRSKSNEAAKLPVQKRKRKVGRPRRGNNSMAALARTTRYRVLKRTKLDDSNFEPPRSTKIIDGNVSPIETRSRLRAREGGTSSQPSTGMSLRRNTRHLSKAIVEFELEGSPPKRRKRQRKGKKENAQEPRDFDVIDLSSQENDLQTKQDDTVPPCHDDLTDDGAIDLSKTRNNLCGANFTCKDRKIESPSSQGGSLREAETGLPFKKRRLSIETTQQQIERNMARTSEISYPAKQMISIAEVEAFCTGRRMTADPVELVPNVPFYPAPQFVHFPIPYMDPRRLY